jgi:hypothetical protein
MKRLILCLALALSLLPASAHGQVGMSIQIGLPVAPPLVVVQPGVQVVENYDEEVFFVGGWYWCRRGDYWYRARRPHASFAYVESGYVPTRLAYLPPHGHYRHWRREQAREDRHWWREHDQERRREWAVHDRERPRDWKQHEQAERHGHGPSHGGPASAPAFARGAHGGPSHGPAPVRGSPAPAPALAHGAHGGPSHGSAPVRGGPAPAPARSHGGHSDDSRGGHGH